MGFVFQDFGFGEFAEGDSGNLMGKPARGIGGAALWTLYINNNSKNPYKQILVREKDALQREDSDASIKSFWHRRIGETCSFLWSVINLL